MFLVWYLGHVSYVVVLHRTDLRETFTSVRDLTTVISERTTEGSALLNYGSGVELDRAVVCIGCGSSLLSELVR